MNPIRTRSRWSPAPPGIGAETVRQLAQAGVHTLLAGRKRETAVEQALKLQAEGLPVEAIQLDVTDAASIAEAVEQVRQRHGRLDILVNNAGIMIENPRRLRRNSRSIPGSAPSTPTCMRWWR
jgi:NAD(P)-dependent dehydrogenase (short-subunit alcohol dehydrogenase family)